VVGLTINVTGAAVHDQWTWRYYWPTQTPGIDQPVATCWYRIADIGDAGNTTGLIALVQNCSSLFGQPVPTGYRYPSGCPCDWGGAGGAFKIAGTTSTNHLGAWHVRIDYTEPLGVKTPDVVVDDVNLATTPLVAVTHGWQSQCPQEALEQHLRDELAIPADHVDCYEYAFNNGVNRVLK
jgi:hypothetical protein